MILTEVREYDDESRTVTIRLGENVVTRSMNEEENAEAEARQAPIKVQKTLGVDATAAIDALQSSIASLQTIASKANADIGPADTKVLARELRRVSRQVLRLTRLTMRSFESADVGD